MKIRITNDTVWPTRMLRPFIVRVANHEFDGSTPKRRPRSLHVHVVYSEGDCSGCAPLGGSWSKVRVPHPASRSWRAGLHDPVTGEYRRRKPSDPPRPFPVHHFVHVLAHEFAHNIGMEHADMGWHYKSWDKALVEKTFPWVTTLPVPVVVKKARPSLDAKRVAKLAAARAAVERWTRKRKLADTKLKRWTRTVRTMERALATAACRKEPDGVPPVGGSPATGPDPV